MSIRTVEYVPYRDGKAVPRTGGFLAWSRFQVGIYKRAGTWTFHVNIVLAPDH